MRILELTNRTERTLEAARSRNDRQALRVAARIVSEVKRRGDPALFEWAERLDRAELRRTGVWVGRRELRDSGKQVSRDFLRAVGKAARNVRRVAQAQLPRDWKVEPAEGVTIRQFVRPIQSVGCYIPGGRHSLVSTLIMTVVPAQVAGVSKIRVVCARPNPELLAAADLLGIESVGRIGGAQAIAALAYGTRSVPRVEKIFGPGNRFVTAAKQLVSGECAIDLSAGPTEAIILAEQGKASWIAADLLAQAEHGGDARTFLVTTSRALAREVQREVDRQVGRLPGSVAAISSAKAGAILLARSAEEACDFINRFAPEHLSLPYDAKSLLPKIHSAGTVFTGPWSAQPLGDYARGSNHVLPTRGWARKRGGLSAADFVKCFSVQTFSRKGFLNLAGTVQQLGRAEGLVAHSEAVRIRR